MRWPAAVAAVAMLWMCGMLVASCGAGPEPPRTNAIPPPPIEDANFKHEAAGIQFDVPGGWRTKGSGDRLMVYSPDGDVTIILYTASEENMDAVATEVDQHIAGMMSTSTPDRDLIPGEINGIPFMQQKGTGVMNGSPVEWTARMLAAKQYVAVLEFGAPGAFDRLHPDLDRFRHSFRPM